DVEMAVERVNADFGGRILAAEPLGQRGDGLYLSQLAAEAVPLETRDAAQHFVAHVAELLVGMEGEMARSAAGDGAHKGRIGGYQLGVLGVELIQVQAIRSQVAVDHVAVV